MESIHDIVYSELIDLEERGVSIYRIEAEIPGVVNEIENLISEAATAKTFDGLVRYSNSGKKARSSFVDGHITALNAFLLVVSAVVTKKLVMLLNKDLRKCAKYFGNKELECIIAAKVEFLKRQVVIVEKNMKAECKNADDDVCSTIFGTNLVKLKRELKATEVKLATMRLKKRKRITGTEADE